MNIEALKIDAKIIKINIGKLEIISDGGAMTKVLLDGNDISSSLNAVNIQIQAGEKCKVVAFIEPYKKLSRD